MTDYIDTCTIYMIKSKDENITDTYVGSSRYYDRRKISHISSCNNIKVNTKIYKMIREKGGFDNFEFKVLNSKI